MPERLTPLEVSLLALDTAGTPGQIGTVSVFDAGAALVDHARLLALVAERISFVPRYRQRVRGLWGRLTGPVWVDDEDFDLSFHVRRTVLPAPGSAEQLRELAAELCAQPLDRSRPLWEVHLVQGVEHERVALVTKSHLSLVDGIDAVELGQVLLDATPTPEPAPAADWRRVPEPTAAELLAGAVWQAVQDPGLVVQDVRGLVAGALGAAVAVGDAVGGVGTVLGELAEDARRGRRPPADSAVTGPLSRRRRVAWVAVALADLDTVRAAYGHPVHDVLLAVVTGALRSWLLSREEPLGPSSSLSALVPVSVIDDGGEASSLGSTVAPQRRRLPVGEPDPVLRLQQLALRTRDHEESGRAVSARSLVGLAGFPPPTLHALGVRVAVDSARSPYDLLVTNVPGPQQPLYAAGARLRASHPVLPLTDRHRLAIGVTSYDGQVQVGLTGDREGLADLDLLASGLTGAVAELVEAASAGRRVEGIRR